MNNNTTLVLEGTNNVTGFYESYPGIYIASGKTLIIQGDGTLNASSNDVDVEDYYGGAGIGAGDVPGAVNSIGLNNSTYNSGSCGTITIADPSKVTQN